MSQSVVILKELNPSIFRLEQFDTTKVAVIVDENTRAHCYPLVQPYLPKNHLVIKIKSGEENKNLVTCQHIWEELTKHHFNRKSIVINIGGGVIGDMGGFCAATYKRGISFIQMPTTLLAQVDASIGGKLGVDFQNLKNHIGVFQIPYKVIIYPAFLKTLSERELRSGYAEVLKHALIADKSAWDILIETSFENHDWHSVISQSYKIKFDVVEADPKELGLRKILNFGHTIGHAIESYLLDIPSRKLLHGEAIAIGMVCEAFLSNQLTGLSESALREISTYILKEYGKISLETAEIPAFLVLMKQDKKNDEKGINCSLLESIGNATFNKLPSERLIAESIEYYKQLSVE